MPASPPHPRLCAPPLPNPGCASVLDVESSNFLVGNRLSREENRSILLNIAKLVRKKKKKNSAKLDIEMSTRSKNFVEFTVGTFIVLIIVKIHISKIRVLAAS